MLSHNENNEEQAIEDGYNLHNALSRFVHKRHVTLFKQILDGKLDESVFCYWLHLQTSVTEAFNKQQVGQVSSVWSSKCSAYNNLVGSMLRVWLK